MENFEEIILQFLSPTWGFLIFHCSFTSPSIVSNIFPIFTLNFS